MNETFYIFIVFILYTVASFVLGFILGKYKGEEIGLRNGGVLTGKEEEVESNRPKSTPYSLDLTPNIFERGNRSRYHYIQSKEDYTRFLEEPSMFWVHWPELSGNWEEDKKIIHNK